MEADRKFDCVMGSLWWAAQRVLFPGMLRTMGRQLAHIGLRIAGMMGESRDRQLEGWGASLLLQAFRFL